MILDDLEHASRYCPLNPGFRLGFEFLRRADLASLPSGRHEIDGDRVTCSGGVAGLDMMVALITRDHGYELGAAVSDWFLHTHVR